ncbi:neo-calmodulin-like [Mytilus galloprovincialis]|uniref:neo-calmodulin-like n=1 Tax=Mytilus galloprovincialis TaxID=29158 RepID=UPI003F7B9F68
MDIGVHMKYFRELTQKEKEECRKAFKQIDINKDNRLSWTELRHASDLLGMTLNEKQAKKMIREVDKNGDGFIDYKEFETIMSKNSKPICLIDYEDEVLRQAFDNFDIDKNGEITKEELIMVLQSLGTDTAEMDASEMLREADLNGDGVISFEEFARVAAQQRM